MRKAMNCELCGEEFSTDGQPMETARSVDAATIRMGVKLRVHLAVEHGAQPGDINHIPIRVEEDPFPAVGA